MEIVPKRFDKKEFLVFLVAVLIYIIIFSSLEYCCQVMFRGIEGALIKAVILVLIIYPVVRFIYVHFNLGRHLK